MKDSKEKEHSNNVVTKEEETVQENTTHHKKSSKKPTFEEILDELEKYDEGCDSRGLQDSGE
ncbi:hypothetical protein HYT52_02840 [Candidatus Woesearchaeota archaeon]|nr:hypothetical protein [Candidatus Woesearchaeota archaeon]